MSKSNNELMSEDKIMDIIKGKLLMISEMLKQDDEEGHSSAYEVQSEDFTAIQGLLDLYQKEKEKNKALGKGQASLMASRKKWKERYYKERTKNKKLELETIPLLEGEINAYREGEKYSAKQLKNLESTRNKYYIHKDKIRDLIKNKTFPDTYNFKVISVEDIKELLEETNEDIN